MRRRVATLLAFASLLGGACAAPVPSTQPSSPGPSASPSTAASLAERLREAVAVDAILADLDRLEALTMAAGGSRVAGSDGQRTVVDFVAGELQRTGLSVTRDELQVPAFRQTGPGAIEIQVPSAPSYEPDADFKPLLLSPAGDVTARIVALRFDPDAAPGSTAGAGCSAADWAGFARGSIVLVQPGECRARQVVELAQEAGAVAMVRSYPAWARGRLLRPTLIDPTGLRIPVLATTHAVGVGLADAAARGVLVRVSAETETTMRGDANVVAETRSGDPSRVIMLGAHLDSVPDGPGINDNGSGAMTLLEIARRLSELDGGRPATAPRIRLAWWASEETGLWGSFAWFGSQSTADRARIVAYLNLDMLGSPNGVRQIYHAALDRDGAAAAIEDLFGRAFDLEGLSHEPTEAGSGDELAFAQAGIATGGLFGGHNTPKTAAQAERFGGVAGELLDPCYHLACDTTRNVDPELLGQMARAAAWVTGHLASGQAAAP